MGVQHLLHIHVASPDQTETAGGTAVRIRKYQVLVVFGLVLVALAFSPFQLSILPGWETYFSIKEGSLIAYDPVSVPVWCKTDNPSIASMSLTIYSDYPSKGGYAVAPTVVLDHVVEDTWQGSISMQGGLSGNGVVVLQETPWQVNPGSYVFLWMGQDVSGIPVLSRSGWFTFSDDTQTRMTVLPASGGATLPSAGDYWFVLGGKVVIYAFPQDEYRLTGWLTNEAHTDPFNPLVSTAIIPNVPITFEPVFETNSPPIALFTKSKSTSEAFVDESVRFDASTSYDADGSIVLHSWDFGDALVGEGKVVDHAYSIPGDYTVTLTVTDNEGASSEQTDSLTIIGSLPQTYTLTITASAGGTTSPAPKAYLVLDGSTIEVLSLPDDGYVLESWLVNGVDSGTAQSVTVTMEQDMSVEAKFTAVGQGAVVIPPWDIDVPQFNMPLLALGGVLIVAGFVFRRRK